MNNHILIVDDDNGHRTMLEALLKKWKYQIDVAENGLEALEKAQKTPYDSILMDIRMPELDGMEALSKIKAHNPAIPIIMMTAYSDIDNAVEAVKQGAYDYLTKPLDFDRLKITLNRSLEHAKLQKEVQDLKNTYISPIIGNSYSIQNLKDLINTVAGTEATVLIRGKSGTGKELVARQIHEQSNRKHKTMIAVNCAALTESLLESELFGHEKGAFTGADKKREGKFSKADGSTIFLDEIGEISPLMQVKLLRVLQQKEIQRVGSDEVLHVDVRIVAATNRNLEKEIENGNFREDLYYRLNVVTLTVPSLKERTGDIPILAKYFLEKFSKQNNKTIKGFSPKAMDLLVKYPYPGNVRELENIIERSTILLRGDYIDVEALPPQLTEKAEIDSKINFNGLPNVERLEDMEKLFILHTLEKLNDNKSEAAKQLGISRKTLHIKLKQYEENSD